MSRPHTEEDGVSIISFHDELYLEDALPGSDVRIRHWLSQQCRFALDAHSSLFDAKEKELAPGRIGPYGLGGPGELLSSVLMTQSTSTVSEEGALRADSPLLGYETERLHCPSATYVRDLPKHSPHSSHSSLRRVSAGRSRSQSNASFHLPTSMQLSLLSAIPSSPTNDTSRRHPPPPQKILSRASSTLSLLANSPNNRNAVYIDDDLMEDFVDPAPDAEPVYFNGIGSSSQVYLGSPPPAKKPTRPPPAPPLIMDEVTEQGGLGGVGVIDEDAIADEELAVGTSVYPHRPRRQQHEETDTETDDYGEGVFMSRWSLTSSMDETLPPSIGGRASMVSAFTVGGGGAGGLFASKKTRSLEKDKGIEDKEHTDNNNKKRGRLVSFISRISSNIASPPHSASGTNTPSSPSSSFTTLRTNEGFGTGPSDPVTLVNNGYWLGDRVPRPPPLSPTRAEGKNGKDKNNEKVKRDDQEENDRDSLPPVPIESVVVVPAGPSVHFPVLVDGAADPTTSFKKANHKALLRVDTSQQQLQQPPFGQLSSSPVLLSSPLIRSSSSPRLGSSTEIYENLSVREDHQNTMLAAATQHQGLKSIVKAFSDGFGGGAMGVGRARSSSAADLLGGGGCQRQQYQYHQHAFGQPGDVQGSSQGQARRYPLHPQPPQHRQQGYPSESGYYPSSHHQRQRRQSQPFQSQSRYEVQAQQQSYSSVTGGGGGYYVLNGTSSLMSPTAAIDGDATTIVPRRPGLVKSVSTSILNMGGSGGYYGLRYDERTESPLLFATTYADDEEDDEEEDDEDDVDVEGGVCGGGGEEEEEDYGVEVRHGGGGGGLASYGSEREEDMITKEAEEQQHRRLETELLLDILRRESSEHSTITATAAHTTPTVTPRVSIDNMSPSSSSSPLIGGRTRSSSNSSIHQIVKNQEQLLAQRVDVKHTRLGSMSRLSVGGAAAVATTTTVAPTPAVKTTTTTGSSKGFRGFVERMKLATTTTATMSTLSSSSSTSSPLSASPIIPPPPMGLSTNVSATSAAAAATAATATPTVAAASNASSPSSPCTSHSPTDPFSMGSGGNGVSPGGFLNDGLFGPDNQRKKQKRQPKRKLVINGVDENDVKGYEAVKAWCESFGEVREMKRTRDGCLRVDFRKASVAETVCRLKTQVFIKGAGSVSLSWYTKESKGLLL